jgi:pimeloyl-ACP methyl ester carboxylesterase
VLPDQGLTKRIHRVSCPSLVVWGRDDDINPPAYAEQFAAALPGSRLELLDGGHLLPYEQPEQVSKLVHEFALSR